MNKTRKMTQMLHSSTQFSSIEEKKTCDQKWVAEEKDLVWEL